MSSAVLHAAATDEELAQVAAERDPGGQDGRARQAYELLYGRHARLLIAFLATRVNRSEIEDVHQEVWLKVWKALPTGFQGGNFRAWLHQIARNYLIDRSRKRPVESIPEEIDLADDRSIQPLKRMLMHERSEALQRCLEKLGPDLAAIVAARLAGENYEEICARANLAPAQAHKLFHKAKLLLAQCVEDSLS
jgi:RNA polymerase sigma-70 factor (ECF subfamily)